MPYQLWVLLPVAGIFVTGMRFFVTGSKNRYLKGFVTAVTGIAERWPGIWPKTVALLLKKVENRLF